MYVFNTGKITLYSSLLLRVWLKHRLRLSPILCIEYFRLLFYPRLERLRYYISSLFNGLRDLAASSSLVKHPHCIVAVCYSNRLDLQCETNREWNNTFTIVKSILCMQLRVLSVLSYLQIIKYFYKTVH